MEKLEKIKPANSTTGKQIKNGLLSQAVLVIRQIAYSTGVTRAA
jgi:hypothetical protein